MHFVRNRMHFKIWWLFPRYFDGWHFFDSFFDFFDFLRVWPFFLPPTYFSGRPPEHINERSLTTCPHFLGAFLIVQMLHMTVVHATIPMMWNDCQIHCFVLKFKQGNLSDGASTLFDSPFFSQPKLFDPPPFFQLKHFWPLLPSNLLHNITFWKR